MTPSTGEIWLVNLDPTVGDESKKVRPAVVVSKDAIGVLALRVVVPVTAWQDRYKDCPWMVKLEPDTANGLDKTSAADFPGSINFLQTICSTRQSNNARRSLANQRWSSHRF